MKPLEQMYLALAVFDAVLGVVNLMNGDAQRAVLGFCIAIVCAMLADHVSEAK